MTVKKSASVPALPMPHNVEIAHFQRPSKWSIGAEVYTEDSGSSLRHHKHFVIGPESLHDMVLCSFFFFPLDSTSFVAQRISLRLSEKTLRPCCNSASSHGSGVLMTEIGIIFVSRGIDPQVL